MGTARGRFVPLPARRWVGVHRRRAAHAARIPHRRTLRTWVRRPRRLPLLGAVVLRRGVRLFWHVRLAAWTLAAATALAIGGWAWLAAGPAAFEVVLLVTTLRLHRVHAGRGSSWPDEPDDPGGAGVREPRRPLPVGGAGAAERPLPVWAGG